MALDHKLDDVTLELVKLAIVRTSPTISLSNKTELRFIDEEGDQLVMAWIRAQTEKVEEWFKVPRQLYDDVIANNAGWQALSSELSAGLFVDMNRLLVAAS